jgi:hypothetical protein
MTTNKKKDVVQFAPNVPVEVALKFALPGKIISTQNGERVLYTLADGRVMFLDLCVAKKVEDLGVNVRQKFFVCRPAGGTNGAEWKVWRTPETEKTTVEAAPVPESSPEEETLLERKLRESIELVKQGKLGELGNGTFAVPAGASVPTPAPVQSGAVNGHQTVNKGNGSTNGMNGKNGKNGNGSGEGNGNGNGNGEARQPEQCGQPAWAESLLEQADALVDVYAAALSHASRNHGNQVKPEDVRSLLVTVFIQRSKVGTYAD